MAVILLAVVSLIPISSLRSFVKNILVEMQGTLGDSFVFASNPLVRAWVLDRVRHDLRWLEARCESIVVVAHSQGAAIAYHSLAAHKGPKVRRLITFGSGLLKLSELQDDARVSGLMKLMPYLVLTIPVYVMIAPALWHAVTQARGAWIPWHSYTPDLFYVASFLLFPPPLLVIMAFLGSGERIDKYRDAVSKQLKGLAFERLVWTDMFSTHDPVPSGAMFEEQKLRRFRSRRVVNRMSVIADHTSYWDNVDEFVTMVVRELAAGAGRRLFQLRDDRRLVLARRARRTRVRWLRWGRAALCLSVVVPIFLARGELLEFGKTEVVGRGLAALETVAWLKAAIGLAARMFPEWARSVSMDRQSAYALGGASAVIVAAGAWYCLMYAVWQSWNRSAMAESLRLDPEGRLYLWRPAGVLLLTGVAVYVAVGCTWFGGYLQTWATLNAACHSAFALVASVLRIGGYVDGVIQIVAWVFVLGWIVLEASRSLGRE